MTKFKNHLYIHLFLCTVLLCALYFAYVITTLGNVPTNLKYNINYTTIVQPKMDLPHFVPTVSDTFDEYNIWLIFTKVTNKSSLTFKFNNLISNLLNVSSVPLEFNVIVDDQSRVVAEEKFNQLQHKTNKALQFKFYDVANCTSKIVDIVAAMTPFFSSKPGEFCSCLVFKLCSFNFVFLIGTYYSDGLFYLSLGLYRIAPTTQKKAILLDCDLYFKKDVRLLFDEFSR